MIPNFVRAAIIAALIVGSATYMAERSHPILAGFLAAMPVILITMLFLSVENPLKFKDYTWAYCLGIIIYMFAAMTFYYLYTLKNLKLGTAAAYALGLWITLVFMAYLLISDKGFHQKN